MSREPNALDALAYVGVRVAEYASYVIIAVCIIGFGVATGFIG